MSVVNNINLFISVIFETIRRVGWGRIWLLLLGYFGLQFLVLLAHWKFLSPVFYSPVIAWLHVVNSLPEFLLAPGAAPLFTHYPDHYIVLPTIYNWGKLAVALLFEGLVMGGAAILFRNAFFLADGDRPLPLRDAFRHWPKLLAVWLILNFVIMAVNIGLPMLLGDLLSSNPRRQLVFEFGLIPLIYAFVLGMFYFTFPSIVIMGDSVFGAIVRSFRVFVRRPFASFFMALMVLVMPLLMSSMASRSHDIIQKFQPELVVFLLMAGLFVEMVAYFFWAGTSTKYLLEVYEQ
jgi:hypothetical protein